VTHPRKRVLFLVPSLIGGGAQRVFSTLIRHVDRDRFEIHLALLEAKGAYLDDLPDDIILHDLKVSRVRYALPSLVRIIWKVRPHTVLSTLAYLNLSLLMVKPFLPGNTRVLVRESTTPATFLKAETKLPRFWEFLYRRFYRKADKVICLSDSMLTEMAEYFQVPRDKLARIYNPVDVELVKRMARASGNPFSGPGPFLVTAGRIAPEKGLDLLLEAMPAVVKNFPNARLFILGEGPLQSQLQAQADRLGLSNVTFVGFQRNPWGYLKYADLFVLPSRYEGLSNALLEALALGTPAVVTDNAGAIREIQRVYASIVLVRQENPTALAEGISLALSRLKSDSGDHLPAGLHNFDLRRVVDEYSSLF
jgi:glycosyltransferase involved in cell wall biosynthesis